MDIPHRISINSLLIILTGIFGTLITFQLTAQEQVPVSLPVVFLDHSNGLKDTKNFFCYKDSKGLVWISSEGGLHCYDGSNMIAYLPGEENSSGLNGNTIQGTFSEDKNRNIWFTTYNAVNCFVRKEGKFIAYSRPQAGQPGYFNGGLDSLNQLWIINGAELVTFDIVSKQFKYRASLIEKKNRALLQLDQNGSVSRIFTYSIENVEDTGFQIVDFSSRTTPAISVHLKDQPLVRVRDLYIAEDSILWVVGERGLFRYHLLTHSWSAVKLPLIKGKEVLLRAIDRLNDSLLLIATYADGLFSFDPLRQLFIENYQLVFNDNVLKEVPQAMYRDRDGGIWISVGYRGIAYFNPGILLFKQYRYSLKSPDSDSRIGLNSLIELDNGQVWGSSNKHGAILFKDERTLLKNFHTQNTNGLTYNSTSSSHLDQSGRVWMLTLDQACIRFSDGTFKAIDTDISFESFCELQDGSYILGSRKGGLYRASFTSAYHLKIKPIPEVDSTHRFSFLYQRNGILFASRDKTHLDLFTIDSPLRLLKSIPLSSDFHSFVFLEEQNQLWMGTDNGIYFFDLKEKTIKPLKWAACVARSKVYGIVPTERAQIWLSTNDGVHLLNLAEKSCSSFDIQHGLGAKNFNRFCYTGRKNGDIWFGSSFGITFINPENFKAIDYRQQVNISGLLINDAEAPQLACSRTGAVNIPEIVYLDLPFTDNTLSFSYSALDYGGFNRAAYEYRMKGLEKEWVQGDNYGFSRYANLSPGQYTFQVRVRGKESSQKAVGIKINPPFYLRWWFLLFVGTLISLSTYGLFRLSEHRKRRIQQLKFDKILALESERLRIANDMHDDLGSSLSAVSLRAKVIAQQLESDQLREEMNYLIKSTDQVIHQVRDTIWTTNSKNDTVDNLATKLHQYTLEYFDNSDIDCKITLMKEQVDAPISGDHRRQLFLSYKEALHNIQKHAEASSVYITIKMPDSQTMEISIKDNGKGFDLNNNSKQPGHGLDSMSSRLQNIGGSFQISSDNKGTTVVMVYPLIRPEGML